MTTRPLSVLVAEDNPVNQEVALGILESLHCEVTIVDNGAEALEAYQTAKPGRFQLILMDCQMPVLDGWEAARRIRAWEGDGRHIPILALTANTVDGSKPACLDAGMDDMLSKPFRRLELEALLDKWCPGDEKAETPDTQPQQSVPKPSLDQKPLQLLKELDPDGSKRLIHRTITKFASYGDGLLADMKNSLKNNDMSEISRLAHSLKSSSANLGAAELSRQCLDIETSTKDLDKPTDIERCLAVLEQTYQAVRQELLSIADRENV